MSKRATVTQDAPAADMERSVALQVAESRLEMMDAQVGDLRQQVAQLQQQLADERNERHRLMGLLEQRMLTHDSDAEPETTTLGEWLGLTSGKAHCPHCGKRVKAKRLESHIREKHMES